MMRSLFSGVSGLKNHQTRMDVIGNNISNVNTTGFKSSRVTFADTLNQTMTGAAAPNGTIGGTNPKQIGLGSAVSSIDLLFTDGSVQSTGKNTDLCLSGNGLFVISNGSQTYYTRNGAFEFDAEGNYVMPGSGMLVQGWTATDGVLNTSDAVGKINIPAGKSMAAEATTTVTYNNNLNSAEKIVDGINLMDSNGNTITIASTDTNTYSIGDTYTDTITSMDVTFSNGATVTGATGQYANGGKYNVATAAVSLANGDTISVPSTSGAKYTIGASLPSTLTVSSFNGTTAALSDGATLTNISNSAYTAALSNGASLSIPSTSTTNTYTAGAAMPTVTVSSMQNGVASLSDGTTLTDSLSNYTVTVQYTRLAGAGTATATLNLPLSTSTNYGSGTLGTPASVSGTTVTLGDGTTFICPTSDIDTSVGVTVTSIANTTALAANVSSISLPNSTVSGVTGTVTSGSGTDPFSMSNGTFTANAGLTVSGLDITGSSGNALKISNSDTTAYQVGGNYTSTVNSASVHMSGDDKSTTKTTGSYTMGYSLPLTTTATVYDTLGTAHKIVFYFTKTKVDSTNGNQWTVAIQQDGSSSYTFDEQDGSKTTITMAPVTLQFSTDGKYVSGAGSPVLTLTNGATGTQSMTVDLSSLSQFDAGNTVNGSTDGHAAGTLESVSIDSSGIITGTYTNGVKQSEAQVSVAQFTNASGLTKTGSSLYQESNNSGTPNVKTAADLGVKITASALEMSNVDIANEFADMIVTQRGFQSNSKIITVGDEMLETVINMKR